MKDRIKKVAAYIFRDFGIPYVQALRIAEGLANKGYLGGQKNDTV
jgi:hypothetical protein